MAGNIKDLIVKIMVDDGDVEKFQKAGGKALDFGKTLDIAAVGSAAALVGMGAGLYSLGSTFDDITDTIRVGTGATGKALDGLTDSAKKVGTEIPVEWSKVGPAVADVNTRLGLTGGTLETVTKQFLEAGRTLGEDVDIQSATGALSAFKIEGKDTSGALDFLFQQAQATGVGFNDLTKWIADAAPITQQLGFSFKDTAGFVAGFDKAGLDSQKMVAAMQKGLSTMVEPGESAADTFKRVTGEIQTYVDKGDEASARAEASKLFGTRGAAQFVGALKSGAFNLNDLSNSARLSGDTILGAAADTNDFAEKWQIVQNKATAALAPLGSAVFSALGDALGNAMPGLTGLADWASNNTGTVGVILGVIAGLAGVILVLAAGMKIFALAQAIQTAAQWASNAAWLANPITWIILAIIVGIAALVAAGIWLYQNWDTITQIFGQIWQNVADWFISVGDGIASWWNGLWAGIASWVVDTFGPMILWVRNQFLLFQLGLRIIGDGIASWWNGLWAGIGRFFSSIWAGLGDIVRGAWNTMIGWIESGVNGATALINGILRGINNVGGAIGIHLNLIPNVHIPRLAAGGITMGPQFAMVGDNPGGREAILPLDSPAARDLLGGGDKPTDLSDSSIERLARALAALLRVQTRQGEV